MVVNFMTRIGLLFIDLYTAAVRVLVKRPIKVNFSLSKVDQARAFLKQLQPVKSQRTEAPREVEEIQLLTTPRDGTKAVGISLPGLRTPATPFFSFKHQKLL